MITQQQQPQPTAQPEIALPKTIWIMTLLACLAPGEALAFQPHDYSGIYIHQFAHCFLIVSLFVFTVKAQYNLHASPKAWRFIILGAWLLIFWNLMTMTGHFLDLYLPETSLRLAPGERVPSLLIAGWKEVLFYILKMDNFLAVPALYCIYRGLCLLPRERPAKLANG